MPKARISLQVDNRTPLWEAARHLLIRRGKEFAACCRAALDSFGLDEIHDFRVSSRRLREALALFAPCYPPDGIGRCAKGVKKVTRLLGALRNQDEAFLFFVSLGHELDLPHRQGLSPFLMSHEAARSRELGRMERVLREYRPERFVERHWRILSCPSLLGGADGDIDPFMPLREFAEAAMSERHRGLLPLVPPARERGDDEARHRLRIALKHYRYRFELFEPLADERYAGIYKRIKTYQDILGTLNDLTVFAAMVSAGLVPEKFMPGTLEIIGRKREEQVTAFLDLLERSPVETLHFPFGGNDARQT